MSASDVWHETDTGRETGTDFDDAIQPRVKVFIHNDDVTPYDFVVISLQRFFGLNL